MSKYRLLLWLGCVLLMLVAPSEARAQARVTTGPEAGDTAPLTDTAVRNLASFARLYGYVRFFHPSDEAAVADWDSVLLSGVRLIEHAATPEELVRALRDVFRPVAPAVLVSVQPSAPPSAPPTDTSAIIFWVHKGVTAGTVDPYAGTTYNSSRLIVPWPVSAATMPKSPPPDTTEPMPGFTSTMQSRQWPDHGAVPDPRAPFTAEIAPGVHVAVPLALFTSLPADTAARVRPAAADTVQRPRVAPDRATRLAAVISAWNYPQHFYPYFDVSGGGWSEALPAALRQAAEAPDAAGTLVALNRLLAVLEDGHAAASAAGWPEALLPRTAHPPLTVRWIDGRAVITAVDDTVRRVAVGDIITTVDGEPMRDRVARADSLRSGTLQWVRYVSAASWLRGRPGSVAELRVHSPLDSAGTARTVQVSRRTGPLPRQPRPPAIAELRPGLWYVDITIATDSAFLAALPQLQSARGIVFDVRGYPGLSWIENLTDQPLHWEEEISVPLLLRPDRRDMVYVSAGSFTVQPAALRLTSNVAVLTDGSAISGAETDLMMVRRYRLGTIVGSPTAGANGGVTPLLLPGGFRMVFTGMRVTHADGSQLHLLGVIPDVHAAPTARGVAEGRDEVLEAGLHVLEARLDDARPGQRQEGG
jgi:C-terminal processing protease CtpA/Prc